MDRTVVFLMIVKKCNAGAVFVHAVYQISSLVMREDIWVLLFFCFFLFEVFSAYETIKIGNVVHIFTHIYYISDID